MAVLGSLSSCHFLTLTLPTLKAPRSVRRRYFAGVTQTVTERNGVVTDVETAWSEFQGIQRDVEISRQDSEATKAYLETERWDLGTQLAVLGCGWDRSGRHHRRQGKNIENLWIYVSENFSVAPGHRTAEWPGPELRISAHYWRVATGCKRWTTDHVS